MNTFARIIPIAKYRKVSYYSLIINDAPTSLFEDFVQKHSSSNKKKVNHILKWIELIGENYGAQVRFFRSEAEFADASALPPKGIEREPSYVEKGKKVSNMLRLYTFRVNESVVFLFNGSLKTTKYAQDCPNVAPHFNMANQLTAALQTALEEKEDLRWNRDFTQIEFDNDFKIEL